MSRADIVLALVTAGTIHAALVPLAIRDTPGGGGGNDGADRISVAAASPALAGIVQTWETRPETAIVPSATPPSQTDQTPEPIASSAHPDMARAVPTLQKAAAAGIGPKIAALAPVEPRVPTLNEAPSALLETGAAPVRLDAPAPGSLPEPGHLPVVEPLPPAPDLAPTLADRPEPRPSTPQPQVAQRLAHDRGKAGTRGTGNVSPAPKLSEAARQAAVAAWAASIQRDIGRHQRYPRGTRAEGRVRIAMVVLADGRLDSVKVARSSGTAALDAAAIDAAKRAAPFIPAPEVLSDKWFSVGQWVTFERR